MFQCKAFPGREEGQQQRCTLNRYRFTFLNGVLLNSFQLPVRDSVSESDQSKQIVNKVQISSAARRFGELGDKFTEIGELAAQVTEFGKLSYTGLIPNCK